MNNMADDQEQKREEMSELPDIPNVPPPPYPGPPDGTQYPPQQVPPYQGTTTYPPQQAPQGTAYPPQGVTYPQGREYPPKEGAFYPPPGYHQQGQYPPAYGQQQYPPGYPNGYQAIAQGGYPSQAYPGQGYAPPAGSMVVTSQPVAASVVPMSTDPKPETYLVLSVITCLCCSPIFGLIAICFAVAADSAYAAGDVNGARRSGRTALILCICGIILTFIVLAMNLLLRTSMYHH